MKQQSIVRRLAGAWAAAQRSGDIDAARRVRELVSAAVKAAGCNDPGRAARLTAEAEHAAANSGMAA
jgi:hypothetical protein